jgi:hypothetical protein
MQIPEVAASFVSSDSQLPRVALARDIAGLKTIGRSSLRVQSDTLPVDSMCQL